MRKSCEDSCDMKCSDPVYRDVRGLQITQGGDPMKNMNARKVTGILTAAALTAGMLSVSAYAEAAAPVSTEKSTVTVNAEATVTSVPDIAEIRVSINTTEESAADAQKTNGEKTDAVVRALKELKIEEKDIQTSNYSMYPQYDYSTETAKLVGYEATTTLTVSNLPIDETGDILAAAVDAGANQVEDISYSCSDYDECYQQALCDAVANARVKAAVLANAAGMTIDQAASITEGWQNTTYRGNNSGALMESSMAKAVDYDTAAGAVSVNPGEADITANVTVVYNLK